MADEGDQRAGDGAKQRAEEGGHAVGGLELGFGHGRGDLHVHEQQHEDGRAEADGDDGARGDFEHVCSSWD